MEDEPCLGTWGEKGVGATYEMLFVMFMDSEETLISYNEGESEFIIDSGKLASKDLGAAVHEYRDVNRDVVGIVTTPENVTQYLHGVECLEY